MRNQGKTWDEIGEHFEVDGERIRSYSRKKDWYDSIVQRNPHDKSQASDKKVYHSDGSITSRIISRRAEKVIFKPPDLLRIHGFDPDEFEIKQVISNEWSMTNSEGEQYYNFQSKIIAKPIEKEITIDDIVQQFNSIQPKKIELLIDEVIDEYLLIPLYDMHFGLNTYGDYYCYLQKLKEYIMEGFQEILIVIGGDFLHVDNNVMTTEKGTRIDDVDVEKMKEDAAQFLIDLSAICLEYCPCVKLTYLKGNHAPSNDHSLLFGMAVGKAFEDIEVDLGQEQMKHAWLGDHSIFLHHGDKFRTAQKVLEVVTGKFPKEWGQAQAHYYISGHKHTERSQSISILQLYQVMSPSKHTTYDNNEGYDMGEQGMQIFRFNSQKRCNVEYL